MNELGNEEYLSYVLMASALKEGLSTVYVQSHDSNRLQYQRPTKRMSYRTIQRNAVKRRKQRAKAPK